MTIFAVESAGRAASAAVAAEGRVISYACLDRGLTHSETLMPLCDRVFAGAGLMPKDIDCFAVTTGPGSFTGLRIGISLIKGMALACGRPCVGAPVNDALSRRAAGFPGVAVTVTDARAGRVFAAAYDMTQDGRRLLEDEAVPVSELAGRLSGLGERYLLVGDATLLCYNSMKDQLPNLAALPDALPSAYDTALLAGRLAEQGAAIDCRALKPMYLQPSQAERNLKK